MLLKLIFIACSYIVSDQLISFQGTTINAFVTNAKVLQDSTNLIRNGYQMTYYMKSSFV